VEGELLVSFGYQQGIGLPNQGKWLLLTFDYESLQTVFIMLILIRFQVIKKCLLLTFKLW
jgi:hypothetical protein